MVRLVSFADAFQMLSFSADAESEPAVPIDLEEETASSLNIDSNPPRE